MGARLQYRDKPTQVSICLFLSPPTAERERERERIRSRETPWHKVEVIYTETRLVIIARPERIALVIEASLVVKKRKVSRARPKESRKRDAQRQMFT